MSSATSVTTAPAAAPAPPTDQWYPLRRSAEAILAPLIALCAAAAIFSIFLLFLGASPSDFIDLVWRGAFGSWFSLQNTLQRAAPLLLTALCVALPGQLGLVIIGGEGALVLVSPCSSLHFTSSHCAGFRRRAGDDQWNPSSSRCAGVSPRAAGYGP